MNSKILRPSARSLLIFSRFAFTNDEAESLPDCLEGKVFKICGG